MTDPRPARRPRRFVAVRSLRALFALSLLLPALPASASPPPASRAAGYAEVFEAFLDRVAARLDAAESAWPARFAQVRGSSGYGEPYGATWFEGECAELRERLESYRGREEPHFLGRGVELAWSIAEKEAEYESARIEQRLEGEFGEIGADLARAREEAQARHGAGSLFAEVEIADARERLGVEEELALQRARRAERAVGERLAATRRELVGFLGGLRGASFAPCRPDIVEKADELLPRFSTRTQGVLATGEGLYLWRIAQAPGAPARVVFSSPVAGVVDSLDATRLVPWEPLERIPAEVLEEAPPARSPARTLRIVSRLDLFAVHAETTPEPEGEPAPWREGVAIALEAELADAVRGGRYDVEVRAASDGRRLGTIALEGGCDEPIARTKGYPTYLRFEAPAPPPLAGALPDELAGRWSIEYEDADLGRVVGRAFFPREGGVPRARFRHPSEGGSFRLEAIGFARTADGGFDVRFRGEVPLARRARPSPPPAENAFHPRLRVPASERAVVLALDDARLVLPLAPADRATPDRGTFVVHLEKSVEPGYVGTWSYAADPETGRDGTGGGRAGSFDPATGHTSGRETWRPLHPRVLFVDVLSDQTGRNEEAGEGLPYPFAPGGASPRRFLAVYGEDLAEDALDPHELRSLSDTVRYTVEAWPDDAERATAWSARDWFAIAARSLARVDGLSPELRRRVERARPIVLRAELLPGVLPGFTGFVLDERPAAWPLLFGGLGAGVDLVGRRGAAWEPLEETYLGDTVAIELRLTTPLPLEEVPVLVLERYDADRERPARIAGAEQGRVTLARTPEDPRVYRSTPLFVTSERRPELAPPPAEGARALALVDPEDSAGGVGGLVVRCPERFQVERFLLPIAGEQAEVTVRERPSAREEWRRAAVRALTCRGELYDAARRRVRGLPERPSDFDGADWDRLGNSIQDELCYLDAQLALRALVVPTSEGGGLAPVATVEFRLGHLAAMILVRDAFARELRSLLPRYRAILADEAALEAYARTLERERLPEAHPLAAISIEDPRGAPAGFALLTWPPPSEDPRFLERFALTPGEARVWHRAQTRAALERMTAAIAASVRTLETPACDAQDLLESAHLGYPAVAPALLARLVVTREVDGRRVLAPDEAARTWLRSIPNLFEQMRRRESEAALDSTVLNLQLAAASLGTLGAAGPAARALGGLDGLQALADVAGDVSLYRRGRRNVELARGASALLGPSAFRNAEREARSLEAVIFNALLESGNLLLPLAVHLSAGRAPRLGAEGVRLAPPEEALSARAPRREGGAREAPGPIATEAPTARQPEAPGPPRAAPPAPDPARPTAFEPRTFGELTEPAAHPRRPRESVPRTEIEAGASEPPPFTDADFSAETPPVRSWRAPDGRTFELEPLGRGTMADAYRVRTIDGVAPETPLVLKKPRFDEGATAEELVRDLAHGADLLAERGVLQLELEQAVLAGEGSYVLQRLAAPGDRLYELTPADLARLRKGEVPVDTVLPEADRRAAARLFDQLGTQGIAWADGHVGNMFFRGEGDAVRAGVLDPDMIFEPGNLPSERMSALVAAQVLRLGDGRGVIAGGRYVAGVLDRSTVVVTSAGEFNQIAAQLKYWLRATPEGPLPAVATPADFDLAGFDLHLAAPGD